MVYADPLDPRLASGISYAERAVPYYLSAEKLESDYAPVRFVRELRLFRAYCPGGTVLDVGCSTGAFLYQLQRRFPGDYAVVGHDVGDAVLDYAQSRGIEVLRDRFLEYGFGERRFEAVTFWAVLEHLAEPARYLNKAAAVLKPGGMCFVLVPNLGSLAMRLLGPRYRYVLPDHVNYFSADTLQSLVGREPAWSLQAVCSTHFNPLVIWQDFWNRSQNVTEGERARLLQRTTAWKQRRWLQPLGRLYHAVEWCLGQLRLADNLVVVLRRI
jgi:SAM-dependent methyltransferase